MLSHVLLYIIGKFRKGEKWLWSWENRWKKGERRAWYQKMNFTGIPLLPRDGFYTRTCPPEIQIPTCTMRPSNKEQVRKQILQEPLLIAVPLSAYRLVGALTDFAHPDVASTAEDQDGKRPIETFPGFVTNANLNPQ